MFLSAAVLTFSAARALAGDYYVDAVNGDDTNSGASPGDAWRTVTHGVAQGPGGAHELHIAPGLYDTGLGESFPIFVRGGLSLRGDASSGATILDGGGSEAVLRVSGALGSTRFESLWLRNANVGLSCNLSLDESHSTALESVSISNMTVNGVSGTVIALFDDARLEVRLTAVTIRDCGGAAVDLRSAVILGGQYFADADLVCTGCLIEHNGAGLASIPGMNIEAGASAVVHDSRIVHNTGAAVSSGSVELSDSVIAFNAGGCSSLFYTGVTRCTIVWNTGTGVSGGLFASGSVQACILYGNGSDLSSIDCADVAYSDIGDGGGAAPARPGTSRPTRSSSIPVAATSASLSAARVSTAGTRRAAGSTATSTGSSGRTWAPSSTRPCSSQASQPSGAWSPSSSGVRPGEARECSCPAGRPSPPC